MALAMSSVYLPSMSSVYLPSKDIHITLAMSSVYLPSKDIHMALAMSSVYLPSREGFIPGSCNPMIVSGQGQMEGSVKRMPKFGERWVAERLERIYKDGMLFSKNNNKSDVLLPVKPRTPGEFYQGKPMKVAYQGVRGSYCQEAAVRAFQRCDALPFEENMESAFQAVEENAVDRAVVPVENSLDGVVGRNYDLLLRHQGLHIVGEVLLKVNHCLWGLNGINGVRRVVSHPQALDHCKRRLQALNVAVEAVDSAAEAARFVAENEINDTGVICSGVAGREFGLRVLEPAMQDDDGNVTRFLILAINSAALPSAGRPWKTTVAFSTETADLVKALAIFAKSDIQVAKVESRPRKEKVVRENGSRFKYVFVVDLEGSIADPAMERAVHELEEIVGGCVRVLGSFPADV